MSRYKPTIYCRRCKAFRPRYLFAVIPRNDGSGRDRRDTICSDCRDSPVRRSIAECLPIPNPNDPSGETMLIPLTKGEFAIIDKADCLIVSRYRWFASEVGHLRYAVGKLHGPSLDMILLHRLLLGGNAPTIDHANGNGLDNRRFNLRMATSSQNNANKHVLPENRSGFVGVTPSHGGGRWAARIKVRGRHVHIGTFDTPEEAARARDERALQEFGEFAVLNFPCEEAA